MPVQFKGMSEYKKHYNWHESFRSQSFTPKPEQASDPAGKSSVCASVSYEPPIQHKKRLDGPPTSLSTNYYENPTRDAEYMVLGQQDKFSENVRYNLKNPKNQGKIYKNKENMDEEAPPNKQLRMQKRIKPLLKERHPPVFQSPPRKSVNDDVTSTMTPQSPPPAPRVETSLDLDEVKATLKDKDLKDVLGESHGKQKPVEDVKAPRKDKTVSKKEEKVGMSVMNESVQTNMKKGIAQASPEAPADYALKYKAGVAPSRTIKKFSEYQKQFQWKHGKKASPLLAAEQIVYTSNTELGPYKTEAIPKVSEYRREFQRWKPTEVSSSLNLNANNNNANDQDLKRKAVVKRSKSAGADLRKKKADESDDKEDVAAELKEKLKKSHGKMRRTGSEYQSNFKAPSCYYSSKGAWKGADPPQFMPVAQEVKKDVEANASSKGETDAVPLSNWFAEVVELRRRADEYRKRAQGTHFSREHLVQLMAQQNECWDVESQASSIVKALNLEAPKINKKLQKEAADSPVLSDIELEDIEEEELEPAVVVKKTYKTSSRDAKRMARMKKDKEAVSQQQRKMKEKAAQEKEIELGEDGDDNCSDDIVDEDEGRQPTPKLKQSGSSSRHHLDLTTPAVGGALLTCPPPKSSKMIVTSRSGDSYVTASDNLEVPQKKFDMDHLKTRPILGQPSGDTHALRDDDASSDRPLNTRYVPSPALAISSDEDKENAPAKALDNKPAQKLSKTTKPKSLTPVQEGVGKTYIKSKPFLTLDDIRANEKNGAVAEDDVMSVSMMSVASSASLASEVLERARKRQKEFWGKGGDA